MDDPRGDAAWTDRTEPPHWGDGPISLGSDLVWAAWLPEDTDHPHLWHWCDRSKWLADGRTMDVEPIWALAGTGAHDLVSRDPLTLSPSVYWPDCCGVHGFVTAGVWRSV